MTRRRSSARRRAGAAPAFRESRSAARRRFIGPLEREFESGPTVPFWMRACDLSSAGRAVRRKSCEGSVRVSIIRRGRPPPRGRDRVRVAGGGEGAGLERVFAYYDEGLHPDHTLVVDGLVSRGPSLSHWPGNRTPERYRADTTTEMALRLAEDPRREEFLSGIRVVSNNHFDTDGLLSVWAVLHPGEALRHRRFLVDAARAGDFGTFTSAEEVKFDLMVTTFREAGRSPLRSHVREGSERVR